MTIHLGDVPASSTLYIPFTTYDKTNGASVTMSGLAVTDIEIYKNGSTTQRASDAGYTLLDTDGIDFDGITGLHGFSVDLSDNTDAGFYAVGSFYWVVVSTITVDSQTVTFVPATFRIVAAEAITGKPKVDVDGWLGTAAATPTVAGVPEVDITHIGGTAVTAASGIPEVKVASVAADAITASAIAANAIGASELAADAATEIADAILSRNVSNVEATAGEHTLCTVILGTLEYSVSGTTWTIKRTDGSTTHATKTLSTDASAEHVTAVA